MPNRMSICLVVRRAEAEYLAFPESETAGPIWLSADRAFRYDPIQWFDMPFVRANELGGKVFLRLPNGREIPVEEGDFV